VLTFCRSGITRNLTTYEREHPLECDNLRGGNAIENLKSYFFIRSQVSADDAV
jgi:hypothetical protein